MKLELAILAGAETKQFLHDLTKIVERLEKAATGHSVKTEEDDTTYEETKTTTRKTKAKQETVEDDEEFVAKHQKYDDDEEAEARKETLTTQEDDDIESFEDEEETEEKPAKKEKAKKLTLNDVNDAAKARVKWEISKRGISSPEARATVLALMKKNFKVSTVTALKPEQYEAFIKIMVKS